jgi:sporulation protein YlmC with PRC-barrel domain
MRWNSLRGTTVVDSGDATSLGTIAAAVMSFDGSATIEAFVVDGSDNGRVVLPFAAVSEFGRDAVTVDGRSSFRSPEDDPEREAVFGAHRVIGKRVITDTGVDMGTASDLVFDTSSGACERIILADDDIPAGRLLGVGRFAVIVAAPARSNGYRPGSDFDDMTKAELYDFAKDADIDGRSTMTKAELANALRVAG